MQPTWIPTLLPTLSSAPTALPTQRPTEECDIGSFRNSETSSCSLCPAGRYGDVAGLFECHICPEGQISTSTGSLQCELCPEGKFLSDLDLSNAQRHDAASDCIECATSTFSLPSRAKCIGCEPGFAANGGRDCVACPAGKHADSRLSVCLDCAVGKYIAQNASAACDLCDFPRFTLREGSLYCDACRERYYLSTTWNGKFDKDYTSCSMHEDGNGEGNACCSCPEGAACTEQSTVETIEVQPGFYRHGPSSPQILKCAEDFACVGDAGNDDGNPCREGFAGALCS